jgi:multidrug efflux pump subunit AcrA (membrane-fusion protein)
MLRFITGLVAGMIVSGTVWAMDSLWIETAQKSITLNGYTRSRAKQTLATEVAGKVLKVNYDVGQVVGDKPFLEIDPTFVEFQIDQARLTLQKLRLSNARATSQRDYLQAEFTRVDRLRKGNVATLAKWEAAEEDLEQAEFALQTADVEIKALSLRLQELMERRSRHTLFAPKGWIVVERMVEPGEIIASAVPLGQVADYTQMVVPLFVTGRQLAIIKELDHLDIMVEGDFTRGKLNWVNPEFDERSRKLAIEVAVTDFKGGVRGGLLTELIIDVPSNGMMVPKASVTNRYDNPNVVTKKDGRTVPITILDENRGYFIIADTKPLTVGMELAPR